MEDIIKTVLDVYFQQGGNAASPHTLIKHQIDSYNDFLEVKLSKIVSGYNPIKILNDYNEEINDYNQKIYIYIDDPHYTKPIYKKQDGTQTLSTPNTCRLDNLSYTCDLYVNARIITEVYNKDDRIIETKDRNIKDIFLTKLPIMVGSKACVLTIIPEESINSECLYDYGGYFIINGNEKVLISQDRIKENYVLVFKPANNTDNVHAEIRSMNDGLYLPAKTISLSMNTKPYYMGRVIRVNCSFLKSEVPVFIMFRALGVLSDEDIIHHVVYDVNDELMEKMLLELRACCDDCNDIYTREGAMNVLMRNLTGNIKNTKTMGMLEDMLITDFIPHVTDLRRKALYLGYMIRKMLSIYLGYEIYDNRDSYINKRIDAPGVLMSNLFRQCYGKITKELKLQIEKDIGLWRANSKNVVDLVSDKQHLNKYFKQSLLDSWLKYALSTGNWGIKSIGSFQNIKQGVSQVLSRMSYNSTLSHLRRINTAMEKNGKLVQPRKLDNSQYGTICPAECFDPNTPILMWDGTIKKAEDIVVDDYLIDDKGNPVRVKSTCSGEKTMYEVIPEKNNFMRHTVTDNHILTLKIKQHKYVRKNKNYINFMWFDREELRFKYKDFKNIEECDKFAETIDDDDVLDITIEKYLSLSKTVKKLLYIFKSSGINWEKKEVAIDPYILGMWLGDGRSDSKGFATADKELLEKWIEWGEDNDGTITKNKHGCQYTIGSTINKTQSGINCNKTERAPLKKLLVKYNLVNNKHIPLDYLTNDRKTRLALLAGFIDTDGHVRANGHEIRICQGERNYRIIYDAEFLARSLGFSCHMNDGISTYTVKGEKRQTPYKELYITGKNLYEIPTVLPRKKLNKCNSIRHEKKCDSSLLSLFKLEKKDVQPYVGWQLDGNGRFLLGDMSMSHNTPEGSPVGLVKNMALSTHISVYMCNAFIKELLKDNGVIVYDMNVSVMKEYLREFGNVDNCIVMVNGEMYGYHKDPPQLYKRFKRYKRTGYIYPMTSVMWDIQRHTISISTEGGRMYRPMFIVDNGCELRVRKFVDRYGLEELSKWDFDAYLMPCIAGKGDEEGFIEYMDIDEITYSMVAMSEKDLKRGMKGSSLNPEYENCEIHPSLMYGILAADISFSNHNQAPRNCYQSAMGKQALGIYATNFNKRMDTIANVLHYPEYNLVTTQLSKYIHSRDMPSGCNAIVAIMTYSGFNQEDGIMINGSAVDRGLFVSTNYKTVKEQCTKNHSTGEEEVFMKPDKDSIKKPYNYKKLGEDGFVPINTFVEGGDVIIGKVMPKKLRTTSIGSAKLENIDCSVTMKSNEKGIIDKNYYDVNSDGYAFCKVRYRNIKKPVIGDKLASHIAQKSSIGMIYSQEDMPFTKEGIVPDLIMNPHAIPSRMTMSQLMCCVLGKAASFDGEFKDGTPYTDITVSDICNQLERHGMEKYGNEVLYDGRTGRQIRTDIFIGPTYYQRLKHMVSEKQHSRGSNGPIVLLTRQPSEGRCLTIDHEILTDSGWKFYNELNENDKVAVLIDDIYINYEKPLGYYNDKWYYKDMYKVCNDWIDSDITYNHRMYVSHNEEKYKFMEAEVLSKYEGNVRYKTSSYTMTMEDNVMMSDDYIKLLAIWLVSGGKVRNDKRIMMLYDYVDMNNDLMGYMKDNICDGSYMYVNNNELYEKCMEIYDIDGGLCNWMFELSYDRSNMLLNTILNGEKSYMSDNWKLLDDIMRLCVHVGKTGIIDDNMNEIHVYDMKDVELTNNVKLRESVYMYEEVFCLSVSSEVFMVRRNGKAYWTGNSRCGGLRLGEMERDGIVAHGSSLFLKERLLECSDNSRQIICKTCGTIMISNSDMGLYVCRNCRNNTDATQIRIPYSFKLLIQELECMNIGMRLCI